MLFSANSAVEQEVIAVDITIALLMLYLHASDVHTVARSVEIFSRTVCFSKRDSELLSRASAGQTRSHGGRIQGQCLQNFCASPNFVVSLKFCCVLFIKTYNDKNLAP